MSSMQFRMKLNTRPTTTNGTRIMESTQNYGSKLIKQPSNPKFFTDQEVTQEELRQLKLQLNTSKKEVQQSRSRIIQLEKELQRYENLIEEHSKNQNSDSVKQNIEKVALVQKLRGKNKQLVEELLEKNKQIIELRKSIKYTNFQELEIEVEKYGEENLRLREKLEYLQSVVDLRNSGESLEKKVIMYEKTYSILHKDNLEFQTKLQESQEQNKKLKQKLDQLNKENKQYQQKLEKYEDNFIELQQFNEKLQIALDEERANQQQPSEEIRQECYQQMEVQKLKHLEELEDKNKEIRDLTTEVYKQTLHIQELEKLLEQYEETAKDRQSPQPSPILNQRSFTLDK